MANLTQADVERIVDAKFGQLRDDVERAVVKTGSLMEGAQNKFNQMESQSNAMMAKMGEHEGRINIIIAGCNEEFEKVRIRYAEQKLEADTQMSKTDEIVEKITSGHAEIEATFVKAEAYMEQIRQEGLDNETFISAFKTEATQEILIMRQNMELQIRGATADIQDHVARVLSGGGMLGGHGNGQDGKGNGKGSGNHVGMDKKDVAVWKLQDNVSKADFRH